MIKPKKDTEWTLHKPIQIKGDKDTNFVIQCRACKQDLVLPAEPFDCDTCLVRMDLCGHGMTCPPCSKRLMLEWIREGNMRVDDFPQLEEVRKMIKGEFGLEVIVKENNYLAIKE